MAKRTVVTTLHRPRPCNVPKVIGDYAPIAQMFMEDSLYTGKPSSGVWRQEIKTGRLRYTIKINVDITQDNDTPYK